MLKKALKGNQELSANSSVGNLPQAKQQAVQETPGEEKPAVKTLLKPNTNTKESVQKGKGAKAVMKSVSGAHQVTAGTDAPNGAMKKDTETERRILSGSMTGIIDATLETGKKTPNARKKSPAKNTHGANNAQKQQPKKESTPAKSAASQQKKKAAVKPQKKSTPAQINDSLAKPHTQKNSRGKKPKAEQKKTPLRIIPLGGLNEIGKNMTLYECENDMFIVDCGLAFPDESMLGIDIVIPDFTFVINNRDKIRGIVITHGHEDHIGGLAYLLKQVNIPVYATRLTIGLIEGKLKEHGILNKSKLHVVKPRDTVKMGCMSVEFVRVNHSIPDAVAIVTHAPTGVIVQTGDFKIDYTPIEGETIDLARFGELGSQGVLALLSDSTNAERPGATMTERKVGQSFEMLFKRAEEKRIIIASFASNIHRIQQICDYAVKYKRKVAVSGRSMENVVGKAIELGYLHVPKGIIVELEALRSYKPSQIVIITTGSQGEPLSALSRMSSGEHRQVSVGNGDFIIISATPIPGNEKFVGRLVNDLMKLGAEVIYEKMYEVHVSGHACQEELKLMLNLVRPKFFIPVHGEYKHLRKHADLALGMGIQPENILISDTGHVIELDGLTIKNGQTVPSGAVMVDGLGVGDVGSIVLRDRKHLSEDGLIIIVSSIDIATGEVLAGPDIVSRGFVYVREAEQLMNSLKDVAKKVLADHMHPGNRDWSPVKTMIKDKVSQCVYQKTKRSPMILPVIMEI